MFSGIPADAFDFYEELTLHNDKGWWTENKGRYEANVKGPVEALLAAVADEFGPTSKIFRPYRDVRFSKDKTPYKTSLGATTTDTDGSVWYLGLSPEGLYVGGGYYGMAKDQITKFRAAVADEKTGPKLVTLIAEVEKASYEINGEQLKRVPPGFDKEHPRGRFLKHKGLYLGKQLEPAAWMGTKKATERIAAIWRGMKPVQAWFHAHVGPSTTSEW